MKKKMIRIFVCSLLFTTILIPSINSEDVNICNKIYNNRYKKSYLMWIIKLKKEISYLNSVIFYKSNDNGRRYNHTKSFNFSASGLRIHCFLIGNKVSKRCSSKI